MRRRRSCAPADSSADYDCRLLHQMTAVVIVTVMNTNMTTDKRKMSK